MVTKKCIHPIKVNKVITEFVNNSAFIPADDFYMLYCDNGETISAIVPTTIEETIIAAQESMHCKIVKYEYIETAYNCVVKNNSDTSMNFSIVFDDWNEEYCIRVPQWKKANYTNDIGGKCFRKDFVSRCPLAKGFADITISLLHELGHAMTENQIPEDYDRDFATFEIFVKADTEEEANALYFNLPDETLATNWAIEWLSNPENRKKAKAFEKNFFACFE